MTQVNFKTIRAQKLVAGQKVIAQVWMTHTRREKVEVEVMEVIGKMVKAGMTVKTDKFTAEAKDGILTIMKGGKLRRVTFGLMKEPVEEKVEAEEEVQEVVQVAKKAKRVRKPLTDAQRARKNELARLRRAAKKAAK